MKKLTILVLLLVSSLISVSQSPVAYYSLDNNLANDSMNPGAAYAGTLFNGPTATMDRKGNPTGAMEFDGIDDYVEFAAQYLPCNADSAFSISMWVKASFTTSAYKPMVTFGGVAPGVKCLGFGTMNGNMNDVAIFNQYCDITNPTANISTPGSWHFLCFTYSEAVPNSFLAINFTIYVDGYPFNSASNVKNPASTPNPFSLGQRLRFAFGESLASDSSFYKGALDDIKLYNQELTAAEVLAEYSATTSVEENQLSDKSVLSIYPNPASSSVTVETSLKNATVSVVDVTGKVAAIVFVSDSKQLVDISTLKAGMYFVQVKNDKQIYSQKLIVR